MRNAECQLRSALLAAGGSLFCLLSSAWALQPGKGPAWPPAPAEPYVVYVKSISRPADLGFKPAGLARLAKWVSGTARTETELVKPFGLSLDEQGNLLVTDTGAGTVCWLDKVNKRWLRWEQVGQTRLVSPVAATRHGDLFFVADSELGKVITFDAKGKLRFEITRDLERPAGLVIAGDRLFIVDSQRHHVVICNLHGEFISTFGQRGDGPGEFNFPTHIAADPAGHLYVTDALNYRVEVFDSQGRFQRTLGSAGDGPGHFSRPKGVAVDAAGHVYVVDAVFDNVQIFDSQGQLLLGWGETGAEPGQFWLPNAIAIARDNTIYVADSYNRRIQVFQYTGQP